MIYFLAFSVAFLFAHIAKKHKNSLQLFFFHHIRACIGYVGGGERRNGWD